MTERALARAPTVTISSTISSATAEATGSIVLAAIIAAVMAFNFQKVLAFINLPRDNIELSLILFTGCGFDFFIINNQFRRGLNHNCNSEPKIGKQPSKLSLLLFPVDIHNKFLCRY
jgi:hypothetical protein